MVYSVISVKSRYWYLGRTELRKKRKGAFWEDRYHATAIETDKHLIQCMVYIDMNMVRAGVVAHPINWIDCGFTEIQNPSVRYKVIDINACCKLTNIKNFAEFQKLHLGWVNTEITKGINKHDKIWSSSLAVGNSDFVENIKTELGFKAKSREIVNANDSCYINETSPPYIVDFGT